MHYSSCALLVISAYGVALCLATPLPPIVPCSLTACNAQQLGCYSDENNDRTLPGPNLTNVQVTYDVCQRFCSYQNYSYAGVEYGSQCFCGTKSPDSSRIAPMKDCNAQMCNGNSSQPCGGADRMLIFQVASCEQVPVKAPYCDPTETITTRIDSLINTMTIQEKISCVHSGGCSIGGIGIPMQDLWRESLHGLRYNCARDVDGRGDANPVCATSFPHAQLLAASFNRSAWTAVGDAISSEARGFYNLWMLGNSTESSHALSFFAPDVNLCRDPRWGRCVEVPGEDPFLTGEYGRHYVRAMQAQDEHGFYKTMCNLKHYNSYDVERGSDSQGHGLPYERSSFNAVLSPRDMVETYLQHFRTIAMAAENQGVMCSYNAENIIVDGVPSGEVPSCANSLLLNAVLRGMFNFTGMVVSDAGAVNGIMVDHKYTNTTSATVQAALRGGTDLNLGSFYSDNLQGALNDGAVTMADVDLALTRVFSQYFRLGVVETPGNTPWSQYGLSDIDSESNRQLALDTATQGMVLLSNKEGALPVAPHNRIALVGPHINSTTELLANYYGENLLVQSHSPLMAFQARSDVTVAAFAGGCALAGNDTSGFQAALEAVDKADTVLLFLGLWTMQGKQNSTDNNAAMEREGFDRTLLTLPEIQRNLSRAVIARAKGASPPKPVVAVFINSGGLDASETYTNADAVLEAFYPGELGGDAIAAVTMGDMSPAGRLPTTIYPAAFTARRNITDMMMRPHTNPADPVGSVIPGITHRFYPKNETIYPFGYGESYTTFEVTQAASSSWSQSVTTSQLKQGWSGYYDNPPQLNGLPSYTATVKNTGKVASGFVMLGFVSRSDDAATQGGGMESPLQSLFGFAREELILPGESRSVTLGMPAQVLGVVSEQGQQNVGPSQWSVRLGGDPTGFAEGTLAVTGDVQEIFTLPLP